VKKQRITVWGFLFAAVLWALAGLRDTFAPGFFSMSGRVMSSNDIAVEFAVAAMFFLIAVSFSRSGQPKSPEHK
jgi:hypothetical protein